MTTLTWAEVTALGQVEALQPGLTDVQVQPFAHVDGLLPAGVAVAHLCSEEA